jgi:hypothetical protein
MDYILTAPVLTAMPNYGTYSYNRIIQELMSNKTQYIVYCNWPQDYINYELALDKKQYYENILDQFISSHYIPVLRINELILYKYKKRLGMPFN